MELALSDEQAGLRSMVRDVVADRCPSAVVRRASAEPAERDRLWALVAGQLGLAGLAVPESLGGLGAGVAELAIVAGELGGALVPTPLLATAGLAATALATADDGAAQRWLPQIAEGALTATVAGLFDPLPVGVQAGVLGGSAGQVLDGATAHLVLVVAGDTLYAVEGPPGNPQAALDATRPLAAFGWDGAAATPIAGADLSRTRDVAWTLLAAECAGAAARCLTMTVDYLKTRVQFGRVLGANQALQHRVADVAVAVDAARATARYAAVLADTPGGDLATVAPLALSVALTALQHAAAENLQMHGGIGFTWEHDAHLYLKRATATGLLFGSPARLRGVMAQRAGLR